MDSKRFAGSRKKICQFLFGEDGSQFELTPVVLLSPVASSAPVYSDPGVND